MINPVLFVGVGGSGRSTLHWLYNELKQELVSRGWNWGQRELENKPGMPRCWQFVVIDAQTGRNSEDPDVPYGETGIVDVPVTFSPSSLTNVYTMLQQADLRGATAGWVPRNTEVSDFNPADGAGQYRAVGRVMLLSKWADVKRDLDRACARLSDLLAAEDLFAVGQCFGIGVDKDPGAREIVMVSSLAGGSGSGMWLDIAQYFRGRPVGNESWKSTNLTGLMYLPEIFDAVNANRQGIAPNTLLALAELMSAYADSTPYQPIVGEWRKMLDLQRSEVKAPVSLFLVGRKNRTIEFSTTADVFQATARALAALAVNGNQGKAFQRIGVNSQKPPAMPLLNMYQVPTSNIGYAKLDLGRRAFGEYAYRRMFRETTRALFEGHDRFATTPEGRGDNAIKTLVARYAENFFDKCLLNESDDNGRHNQIVDGLLPPRMLADLLKTCAVNDDLVSTVGAAMRHSAPAALYGTAFRERGEKFKAAFHVAVLGNIQSLTRDVTHAVTQTVAEYSAQYSVPVTRGLLRQLDAQLARASEQLETEERRISTSFGTEPTKTVAATLVSELGKDKKKDTAGVLGLVLESFLTQTARLETYGFARAFIRDVRVGLIQPLELALDQWFTRQRTVLDQSRTWNAIVREWDGLQVPSDLRPAATTILVEPQDSIPGSFEACLGLAFEGAPLLDALPKAVSEIVRGAWGANAEGSREQRLISFEQSFSLGVARSDAEADQQAGMDTRTLDNFVKRSMVTPAAFSVTGLESIEPVCRSWVLDRDGFTDFVHEGFRGWLDPNGIHIVTRRARFADKFELALRSAEPTVAFSQDAMLRIRGAGQVEPTEALAVSPYLPFADTDPLASEVRQLLAPLRLGLSNDNFVVNEADTSELNFVRSFPEGIHPLALSSLTDPILKSVREAEQKYWVGRRSRPLAHSLGLTPAQVTAFCRGWLVLRLLDLIDVKTGKVHHELQPIAIPRDRLTGKLTAENLALSRKVGANRDVWFRIALESLPLRLVNYPRDEKSLNFYVSVIELGGYQGTDADAQEQLARKGDVSLDDNLYIEILEAWLKDGVKPGELNEAGDFAQRYQDVKTTLTDLEHTWAVWTERLEAGEIESVRDPAPLTAPQQMSRHYLDAVRQLLDYVAAICGDASGEDEDQLSDMPDG